MNTKTRTENSIKNASAALICQFSILLISFISRKVFIQILGSQYLGISGLFTNILSILSLADLGMSTAIAYSLYKPIASNDYSAISAIVDYFGKIYKMIAVAVLAIGLLLLPVLDKLISAEITITNIRLYYLIYLFETVSSYLFVYKSILLSADQRQNVIKRIKTVFLLFANIVKLFILYITKSFTLYLVFQVLGVIAGNIAVSFKAEKEYPFLQNNKEHLDDIAKKNIFSDIKALFIYKIGSVILHHTDNILISVLVSTTVVGFYSNYTMITGTIVTFSELLFGALSASIGNKSVTSEKESLCKTFNTINFANFWVYGFCSICLFCLMDDFIRLWIGEEYVLGTIAAFIISFNVFIPGMLSAVSSFRNATGLFKQTKYVYLLTAILNLFISILFGSQYGLLGIIAATGLARLLTNVWFEPYMLFRHLFKSSSKKYFLKLALYYACFLVPCAVIWIIKSRIFTLTIASFCAETAICVLGVNFLYYLLFGKTTEFTEIRDRILATVLKKQKKY